MPSRLVSVLAVVCLLPCASAASEPVVVTGRVTTTDGAGIPYANVWMGGSPAGAATDGAGHFRFRTRKTGPSTLRASAVGYRTAERPVELVSGDTTSVRIVLRTSSVQLDEAVVTGEAFTTGPDEAATLGPTEAVTTPGAKGDLFRALQTFAGVAAPGDGAGLFVRGGDVTETKTLLDGATVYHPYRYESPAGGSFGTVRPFLVDGTQFSTGGFSARYGNALSGVLAMESQDRPTRDRQYLNLGLAAASISVDQSLGDEWGLRLSGNRSFTGLLFRVNGQAADYATAPRGLDGNLGFTWDYSQQPSGQLKLFSFARRNRIGVETTTGAYQGLYRSTSTNQLHNLQWTTAPGDWTVETSASWARYASRRSFGTLDLEPTDTAAKLRVDATRSAGDWTLRTGGTVERRRYQFEGRFPTQPGVVGPDAPALTTTAAVPATRAGGYAEVASNVLSPVVARLGLRADAHSRAGGPVVDPRVALAWRFSPRTSLRAAWGVYHQFPELSTIAEHTGDNALRAQRAEHVVLGLRHERDNLLLRAEAYRKPYRNLVVRTGAARYANAGTGLAQGLDLFAKYGAFLETRVNGWLAYSLLESRRTQPRDRGPVVTLEQGPAPFDLRHQFTAVGKVRVVGQLRLGGTYRYVTGAPFTPVVGTEQLASGALLPVDGPVGGARLPAYHRLDLQMSYYWPFGDTGRHIIFYAALNNALDRTNIVDVTYGADYAEREYRYSQFARSVYVGLTLTL